ncbi:response regulator [Crocosphaera chwakensis]|uniref:Multi-component Transcriptional regulator, Winged helix family protein n=1 Tax=Crocosphaera chwakensis CCY0110 TaxID=391612 RepID=A3IKK7_9CHRO|nr:response regulator [Crocosphaera chwakensis]EAZ93196.1 Multi-component Transcriptional regulator, Winged helix family protein [Crocosphaera chwakensis CCY0110]
MKILLIEDDQLTSEYLAAVLKDDHFVVDVVFNGQEGLDYATLWDYDVIILDLQLPKIDGISLCRQLRSKKKQTPILILTACQETDKISIGLNAGADDYVLKPCDPPQLIARIRALTRRGNNISSSSVLTWGQLSLNLVSAQVTYKQQVINLRNQEYHLLELFLRHPQRIFSRSLIINHLWETGDIPSESAVTNLVKDLRNKIKAAGMEEDMFETIYGLGYRLNPVPPHLLEDEITVDQDGKKTKEYEEGIDLINQLTDKFIFALEQRISTLEEIILLLQSERLSSQNIEKAKEEAHQLAGSLGTYGYNEGSKLARTIEDLLKKIAKVKQTNITDINELLQLISQLKQEINTSKEESISKNEAKPTCSLVLSIGLEESLLIELQQEALLYKLQLSNFQDLKNISNVSQKNIPKIILLKINKFDKKAFNDIRSIQNKFPTVPILILATEDDLTYRLKAARYGIKKYLVEPVSTKDILETINTLLSPLSSSQTNIMIVDDDPIIVTTIRKILHPWGFQITGLSEVNQFWNILTQTNPDLLILDLEMPTINGIELCRVVRQDKKYATLPIIVVTAHTEIKYLQKSFEAGANDFLSKPIIKSELVARVFNQIDK